MPTIRKRVQGGHTYYYLEHSIRSGSKVEKKERYLGKEIPKDIEQRKREFLFDIYRKTWFERFDHIKKNYAAENASMPPTAQIKARDYFLVRFTYNTNRIEGSTLTLKETARLLEEGLSPNKPRNDILETEAHKAVFLKMLDYKKDLTLDAVLDWHRGLFEGTDPDIAGSIRRHPVGISQSRYEPPQAMELDDLLRDFFAWYKRSRGLHPLELAALTHFRFVSIHPFSDGNGRISRLMMNFVLNKHGFPMTIIQYEKRNSYYNALERAQVKGDERIFTQWFFKRYLKEWKGYL
jgi:Fic family protein